MSGLAFLGGLGKGYVDQSRYQDEKNRLDQEQSIRLADAAFKRTQQQRTLDEQSQLSSAAAPAQVDIGAGGMTKPAYADNSDVGQPGEPGADNGGLVPGAMVNGQSVPDANAANTAATAYNDPSAVQARQAAVMNKFTPGAGIGLQSAALKLSTAEGERARQIKMEGMDEAARAAAQGDPNAVFDAFNKSGSMKFTEPPTVTVRTRDDIPGMPAGTKTYDYSGTITDGKGNTRQGTINSFDYGQSVLSPKEAYELAIKGTGADSLGAYRSSVADARKESADASKQRAQAYADREEFLKTGNLSKENRLKYTDMFNRASQNMKVAQDAINRLQSDRMFMRAAAADPASTQAAQLRGLQSDLAQHKADYTLYQGFLSNVGKTGTPGAAAPRSADETAMAGEVSGDMGADPAVLQREIDKSTADLPKVADATSKAQLTAHIADMRQQLAKVSGPALGSVPFKGSTTPVKISTAAQRDALPKGTTYVAPNGQQYVKQ